MTRPSTRAVAASKKPALTAKRGGTGEDEVRERERPGLSEPLEHAPHRVPRDRSDAEEPRVPESYEQELRLDEPPDERGAEKHHDDVTTATMTWKIVMITICGFAMVVRRPLRICAKSFTVGARWTCGSSNVRATRNARNPGTA